MARRGNIDAQKRMIAWIKWYPREVNQLCVYATMLLNQPQELMRRIIESRDSKDPDSLENRTLQYVRNCMHDLVDHKSELYEWEFEYSDEFNAAFERRRFDKRPHFFAENMVSNEIVAYGV